MRVTLWTEKKLIENRINDVLADEDELRAYHRFTLGIEWKPKKTCQHPHHVTITHTTCIKVGSTV